MIYFTSKFNSVRILLSELSLNFGFHCGLPLLLLLRTESYQLNISSSVERNWGIIMFLVMLAKQV